jgi:hypothetical protein
MNGTDTGTETLSDGALHEEVLREVSIEAISQSYQFERAVPIDFRRRGQAIELSSLCTKVAVFHAAQLRECLAGSGKSLKADGPTWFEVTLAGEVTLIHLGSPWLPGHVLSPMDLDRLSQLLIP